MLCEKNREDRPLAKTGHGSRCSEEAGMFLLAVPLQRLHVFLPLTNLSQARATVLGLSLWSINHYDSCWPAQVGTLTTITGSSADWTLSMPKYLCCWHTSFHKASDRQVKPARNVHFLELAFSWACVNSQNLGRTSCDVFVGGGKYFSWDIICYCSRKMVELSGFCDFVPHTAVERGS